MGWFRGSQHSRTACCCASEARTEVPSSKSPTMARGVPAEIASHLFEPFFSGKEHGTGLGLAIAKRTIDAHGGRICVRNGDGRGLAMHIELPLDGAE